MTSSILRKTIREIIQEKIALDEVMRTCLQQRKKYKHLNIFIEEEENPNNGIPVSIKDVFLIKNHRTTAASKMLSNFIAPYSATLVERIQKNHFSSVGTTNLDEFAMGSAGVSSYYGPVVSIWKNNKGEDLSPGGSSSGAAMSVATGSCYVALATDTSGSVRLPASYSGIVGFKPTYGVFSRYGVIPLAESFDHPGLLARKVDDIRFTFEKLIGKDPMDLTSVDYKEVRSNKKKFAIIKEIHDGSDVMNAKIKEVEQCFINDGYEKKEFSIKELEEAALAIYVILCRAECSSNLQRYDGIRFGFDSEQDNLMDQYFKTRSEGFGLEVQRRILTGAFVSSSENVHTYVDVARKLRQFIKEQIYEIFKEVDFVLMPTAFGAMTIEECKNVNLQDPIKMQKCDRFTVLANITGFPAISVPVGYDDNGAPFGIDIMGRPMQDLQIMEYGEKVENSFTEVYEDLLRKLEKDGR